VNNAIKRYYFEARYDTYDPHHDTEDYVIMRFKILTALSSLNLYFRQTMLLFCSTPFRPPPSVPGSTRGLPPMTASSGPPPGGKSLPIMKLPTTG